MRLVLTEDGLSVPKVAILVGGPGTSSQFWLTYLDDFVHC